MSPSEEYNQNRTAYELRVSQLKSLTITLTLVCLGAIYTLSLDKAYQISKSLLVALLILTLSLLGQVIAYFCNMRHYELWFDKKIKTIDYQESNWGKMATNIFWFYFISFLFGVGFFLYGFATFILSK